MGGLLDQTDSGLGRVRGKLHRLSYRVWILYIGPFCLSVLVWIESPLVRLRNTTIGSGKSIIHRITVSIDNRENDEFERVLHAEERSLQTC